MNERIKELAHEAGLPTYNPEGIPTKLEKFAELIVRECVAFLKHDLDDHFAAEQLQDHFEIEPEQDDETCPRCGDSWSGTSCGIPNCGWVTGVDK